MKKLLSVLLTASMVASLAACSSQPAETEAAADTATEAQGAGGEDAAAESTGGEEYDIIYLTPSTASQFWTHVEIGIKNAMYDLEESEGVKINYSVVGPAEESQTEEYVTAFEQAIAAQPDAIVTATLAIDATVPKAQEATANGIVLNFVNCGLGVGDDGAHEETYNQFYYCSNDTIGELAAQAFLEAQEAMNARQAEEWMAYTEEERLEGLVEPVETDPVEAAIQEGAEAAGIDPILIRAMIQKESQWNAGAMGDGGRSYGLMQIHKRFHTDRMARLGVTTMSAESKTDPGGYYSYPQALEQFHVNDERTAVEVAEALRKEGVEPVWKDWDSSFDAADTGCAGKGAAA